jgi:hypothetical protein
MTVLGELPAFHTACVFQSSSHTQRRSTHHKHAQHAAPTHTHVHTHVIRVVRNDYIIRVIRNYKIIRFIRIDAIIWIYSLLQLSGLIVGAQQDQWATSAYIVKSAGSLTLQPVVSTNRSL